MLLQGSTRDLDLAFRYGGEEFLFLMPGTNAAKAQERAEEIRERIQALCVIHYGTTRGTITASFGIAVTDRQRPPGGFWSARQSR